MDGNGVLHYRGFGSACQLGLLTDIPTIGVAKKLLAVDRMEEKAVRKQVAEQCMKGGDAVDLVGSSGKVTSSSAIFAPSFLPLSLPSLCFLFLLRSLSW